VLMKSSGTLIRWMGRMPPDGAAHRGVEDFSGDCSPDAHGNCDEHAPNACLPAAGVRAVASFVCARAHRASPVPGRPADPDPIVRAAVAPGWDSRWRLTAGNRGAGTPHSVQRDGPSPAPARRCAAGAWVQHTQNGPPSVASRKYEPPLQCPARGASRLPLPQGITPPRSTRRDAPRLGQAPCRGALPLARPDAATLSRLRAVPYRGGGSARLPANPANATAPAHTASGSNDATSGRCGPPVAGTTQP